MVTRKVSKIHTGVGDMAKEILKKALTNVSRSISSIEYTGVSDTGMQDLIRELHKEIDDISI